MDVLSEAQTVMLLVAHLNVFLTLWCQSCNMVITCMGIMSKCDPSCSLARKNRNIFTLQCIWLGRTVDLPVAHCRIWASLSGYPVYNHLDKSTRKIPMEYLMFYLKAQTNFFFQFSGGTCQHTVCFLVFDLLVKWHIFHERWCIKLIFMLKMVSFHFKWKLMSFIASQTISAYFEVIN